eukprot:g83163.t1
MSSGEPSILVLYGSQGGNAQSIAESVLEDLKEKKFENVRLSSCNSYTKTSNKLADFPKERIAVFIVSTTGQGDPPENARQFFRFLKRNKAEKDWLSNLQYAILALGDTNYTHFCGAGKFLHKLLSGCGAKPFIPIACADDAVSDGLEKCVEPWRANLPAALKKVLALERPLLGPDSESAEAAGESATGEYNGHPPAEASVKPAATETQNGHTESSASSSSILLLYGSEGGNAKSIAESLLDDLKGKFEDVRLFSCNTYAKESNKLADFPNERLVVFIMATTGQGDPPENARQFFRFLKRNKAEKDWLSNLQYAILALGDTNYTHFCGAGKFLHKLLSGMGAKPFIPMACADDAVSDGLEKCVEPWRANLPAALEKVLSFYRPLEESAGAADGQSEHGTSPGDMASSAAKPAVLVLFGTQTQNAQHIAGLVAQDFKSDFETRVSGLDQYVKEEGSLDKLPANPVIVVICSTTGVGDLPDNARVFYRHLKRYKDPNWLAGVNVAVLGLGDTNYDKFCESGIRFHKEFASKGATAFLPLAKADDATGLEAVVEPWRRKLLAAVREIYASSSAASSVASSVSSSATTPSVPAALSPAVATAVPKIPKPKGLPKFVAPTVLVKETTLPESAPDYFFTRWQDMDTEAVIRGYTPEAPFMATLANAKFLTRQHKEPDARRVLHMELELPKGDQGIEYHPGDAIGVYCPNDPAVVDALLARLGLEPTFAFTVHKTDAEAKKKLNGDASSTTSTSSSSSGLAHIISPCTARDTFTFGLDISTPPRKAFLRMLAHYCRDPADKKSLYHLAAPAGDAEYQRDVVNEKLSLLDLLERFPSCHPPLDHLFSCLPPLKARYYSVSSSPFVYPNRVHIALTVVRYHTPQKRVRSGLCSNWLYRLAQEANFVAPSQSKGYLFDSSSDCEPDTSLRGSGKRSRAGSSSSGQRSRTGSSSSGRRSRAGSSSKQQASEEQASTGLLPGVPGVYWDSNGQLCLPVFLRRATDFTLPEALSTPVVMVGLGTGVTPYRGFMQHRRAERKNLHSGAVGLGHWRGLEVSEMEDGAPLRLELARARSGASRTGTGSDEEDEETDYFDGYQWENEDENDEEIEPVSGKAALPSNMVLFVGCRHEQQDYLYRSDWEDFLEDGTLSQLLPAFSRDSESKVYVTHRMLEHGGRLADLILKQNAKFYICGDNGKIAKDIMDALAKVLSLHSEMDAKQAEEYVKQMKTTGRYVTDIWMLLCSAASLAGLTVE